jgi:hypothetical protein
VISLEKNLKKKFLSLKCKMCSPNTLKKKKKKFKDEKKRTLLLLLKTKMLKEKEQKVLLLTKLQIQTFYTDL